MSDSEMIRKQLSALADEHSDLIVAEASRILNARRRVHASGGRVKLIPCPKCGDMVTTRALLRGIHRKECRA